MTTEQDTELVKELRREAGQVLFQNHPETRPGAVYDLLTRAADALERRAVPEGHVMLPGGKVVKVLGTLPMTADGCVVVLGSPVYYSDGQVHEGFVLRLSNGYWGSFHSDRVPLFGCYSTREAALAARREQGR